MYRDFGNIRQICKIRENDYCEVSQLFKHQRHKILPTNCLRVFDNFVGLALIPLSQLICIANQLTGFYMSATLALNGLKG